MEILVESWVQPKAIVDTSDIIICPDESFVIKVDFEGKPPYRYKWKLYEKNNPEVWVEDHTTEYSSSISPSIDIPITALQNNSDTEKEYVFEITEVKDSLKDDMPCNVSMARQPIYVQPKQTVGTLKSSNHLISRK